MAKNNRKKRLLPVGTKAICIQALGRNTRFKLGTIAKIAYVDEKLFFHEDYDIGEIWDIDYDTNSRSISLKHINGESHGTIVKIVNGIEFIPNEHLTWHLDGKLLHKFEALKYDSLFQ